MASPASPAEMRAYIVERLTGATGEPDRVLAPARALAERALPALVKGLAGQLSASIPIEIESVDLTRFSATRDGDDGTCVMTTASSPNSPDALTLSADALAVAFLVSVLFGGDPEEQVAPIERPLSPTEIEVASMAFDEAAKAINGSGERAFALELPLPRPVTGAELAKQSLRDGPAVRIVFVLGAGSRRGRIVLMMPQRVLLKHRSDASAPHASPHMADGEWRERFGEEVMRSAVMLEATLPLANLTLAEIACFREGQVIEIAEVARSSAKLSARNKTLFVCEFGKLGQNYTVRIRYPFDERQDLIDGLMTA